MGKAINFFMAGGFSEEAAQYLARYCEATGIDEHALLSFIQSLRREESLSELVRIGTRSTSDLKPPFVHLETVEWRGGQYTVCDLSGWKHGIVGLWKLGTECAIPTYRARIEELKPIFVIQ